MNNLYDHSEYRAILADMKVELKRTRTELNETDVQNPEIQAVIHQY